MTPVKKCNRPGRVCNRSCMGGGVAGSPESECPYPPQEADDETEPASPWFTFWLAIFLVAFIALAVYVNTH